MGRWAQRSLRGGGGPSGAGPPLISILSAVSDGAGNVTVTFTDDVIAAAFSAAAFADTTLPEAASSIIQGASDELIYGFGGTPIAGDVYAYTDTVAGVATPQSGLIT